MRVLFIRLMQVIFLIGLSVNSVHADYKELDKIFLEEGIVDKNYRYIDKKLASKIFTEINNEIASSLPINIDANTEITSIFHSPNFAMYSYTLDLNEMRSNPLFMEALRAEFASTETTQDFCGDLFAAKFQQVNGYTLLIQINEVSGEKIIDLTLDEKICPMKKY